ncbi:MAG: hypothetical protein IPP30_06800 [Flavobacterium sp.]|nr:hypothetical protein [Flavobacterium sp.]
MATFNKGILGGFSGKVGTIVGSNWRGLDVIRSLPKKTSRLATEKQLIVQAKFSLIAHFLAPLKPLLRTYFGQPSGEKSRFNMAFSYHNREAIIGTYPDFELDYQKVIICKGDLLQVEQPAVSALAGAELKYTWQDNSGEGEAKATDMILVVVYNPARDLFSYKELAAQRDAGVFGLALPNTWVGETVHTWLSIVNAAETKWASSVYLGDGGDLEVSE